MAKRGHARSAITGRYVSRAPAARPPRTTVVESRGDQGTGTRNRSAITGRYVTGVAQCRVPIDLFRTITARSPDSVTDHSARVVGPRPASTEKRW